MVFTEQNALFNLVGYVRYDLDCFTEIITAPLAFDDAVVNLPGGSVGVFRNLCLCKTVIMTEVEIGFSAVRRDINLAVLKGIHCAWIHIEIGIEFEHGNLQPAIFK